MRKLDIMIQVLSEVTGKDKKAVNQETIETLRKEGPGILMKLQRGAAQVESVGSKTVH